MRVTELIQIEIDDVNLIMGFVKVFWSFIEYLDTYINNVRLNYLKTVTNVLF